MLGRIICCLFACFTMSVYKESWLIISICRKKWEMYSIFSNFRDICMYRTWAWTGVSLVDVFYYKHLNYFSFLQIHVGVFVTFFTFSGFPFLFVMLKSPLKMQTAICHTSIYNWKKLQKGFGRYSRPPAVLPDTKYIPTHWNKTPASVFLFLAVLCLRWLSLDALVVFLCFFIKCTSSRSTRAVLVNWQTWLWN